jgi:hypothetical protein
VKEFRRDKKAAQRGRPVGTFDLARRGLILFSFLRRISSGVLHVACDVMRIALGLVDFTFGLQLFVVQ